MYQFRRRSDSAYPITPDQIRSAHKANVSFGPTVTPEVADELGYDIVQVDAHPAHDPDTHVLLAVDPQIISGVWRQQWIVYPLSPEIIAAKQLAEKQTLQAGIISATQDRLDTFAKSRNYDGILSACTYVTSSILKFAAEGQAAVNARDATWATLYTILGEVQDSTRPMPTGFADIEAELPALEWPV